MPRGVSGSPRIAAGLLALNGLSFAIYIAREALSRRVFFVAAVTAMLLTVSAAWSLRRGGRLAALVGPLQLSLLSAQLLLWMMQGLLLVPGVLPASIASLIESGDTLELRRRFVEYLEASPYAKLKPNTVVRVPGIYGPADDFVYEWQTDRRGFKNLPAIAALERVPIVALGDSFTEGLGVATERSWPSVLTRRGYATYSLGVQGYAPSQMAGVLRLYGSRLHPQWVVVGYVGNSYRREGFFLQTEAEILGAIHRQAEADLRANPLEVRKQYKHVGTAILVYLNGRWQARGARLPPEPRAGGIVDRYKAEVQQAEGWLTPADVLAATPEWIHAQAAFASIVQQARAIGAGVVFVMLRNRGGMYYRAFTGKPLPAGYGEDVEANVLEAFCARSGAFFVDTKPRFQAAASRLDPAVPGTEYPYLLYDGHPSPRGHELIADAVQELLETQARASH
jgi:hypothetical protein